MRSTVLIVDDNPANLGVLVDSLAAAGHELLVAEDGEDALTQTAATSPDLILLDAMMPGLDGFETCRRLKASATTAEIPVIFMTALGDTADKVRAFDVGAVDYVTKPFQQEEILSRVRTHLELRRVRRELREQLAHRERFMRIAGHDLRNQVCLSLLTTELATDLLRTPEAPDSVKESVGEQLQCLAETGVRMREIIDTFLDLRPRNLEGEPKRSRTQINLIISAVVSQFTHAAGQKQIKISLELDAALPPSAAQSSLIFQAVTNYLGNALKFTPPGGRVWVRSQQAPGRVRVEIADTGPGVPADERDRLFREHARISTRPTAGEPSHGIGLSIVKHLVGLEGGTVGADFAKAGGSCFWFELPL